MRQLINRLITILLLSCTGAAFAHNANTLSIPSATSEFTIGLPNNLYGRTENGVPTGIIAEIINEIFRRMGYNYNFVNIGSENVITYFKIGKLGILGVQRKNSKYKNAFKDIGLFSDPIVKEYNIIAVRQGETFPLITTTDLQNKTLGMRAANEYDPPQNLNINIQKFDSKGDILRALILKHTDASIITSLADAYDLRTEGVMKKVQVLDRAINYIEICAVFSKELFTQQDVDNFNSHLQALKKEPVWEDILSRNGFGDLVRDWDLVGD